MWGVWNKLMWMQKGREGGHQDVVISSAERPSPSGSSLPSHPSAAILPGYQRGREMRLQDPSISFAERPASSRFSGNCHLVSAAIPSGSSRGRDGTAEPISSTERPTAFGSSSPWALSTPAGHYNNSAPGTGTWVYFLLLLSPNRISFWANEFLFIMFHYFTQQLFHFGQPHFSEPCPRENSAPEPCEI